MGLKLLSCIVSKAIRLPPNSLQNGWGERLFNELFWQEMKKEGLSVYYMGYVLPLIPEGNIAGGRHAGLGNYLTGHNPPTPDVF